MASDLFTIINDVSHTKNDLLRNPGVNTNINEKTYNPWVTNRNFSLFVDTILYANEINQHHHLDNLLQHDFYLNSLRPKKRFSKRAKKLENGDVELISRYYQVNISVAEDYLKLMSPEDMKTIRSKFATGGLKKNE